MGTYLTPPAELPWAEEGESLPPGTTVNNSITPVMGSKLEYSPDSPLFQPNGTGLAPKTPGMDDGNEEDDSYEEGAGSYGGSGFPAAGAGMGRGGAGMGGGGGGMGGGGGVTYYDTHAIANEVNALVSELEKYSQTPSNELKAMWDCEEVSQSRACAQLVNNWQAQSRKAMKVLAHKLQAFLVDLNGVPTAAVNADTEGAARIAALNGGGRTGSAAPSRAAITQPPIGGNMQPQPPAPSSNPDGARMEQIAAKIGQENHAGIDNLYNEWKQFGGQVGNISKQMAQSAAALKDQHMRGKTSEYASTKLLTMSREASHAAGTLIGGLDQGEQVKGQLESLKQQYTDAHHDFHSQHPNEQEVEGAKNRLQVTNTKLQQALANPINQAAIHNAQLQYNNAKENMKNLRARSQQAQLNFNTAVQNLSTSVNVAPELLNDNTPTPSGSTSSTRGSGGGSGNNNNNLMKQLANAMKKPNQNGGAGSGASKSPNSSSPDPGSSNKDPGGQGAGGEDPSGGLDPGLLSSLMNPDQNNPNDQDPDSDDPKLAKNDNADADGSGSASGDGGGGGDGDGSGYDSASAGLAAALGAYPGFNGLASAAARAEGALGSSVASALGAGANPYGQQPFFPGMPGGMNGAKGSAQKNKYAKNDVIYEVRLAGVLPGPVVGSKPPALPAEVSGKPGAEKAAAPTANA